MKADYEKMVAEVRKKAIEALLASDAGDAPKRKTAKEMGVSTDRCVLGRCQGVVLLGQCQGLALLGRYHGVVLGCRPHLPIRNNRALELVRQPMGALNWALFVPDPVRRGACSCRPCSRCAWLTWAERYDRQCYQCCPLQCCRRPMVVLGKS